MGKPLLGPSLSTTGHTIFYDTNDNDDELWNISVNDRNTQEFDFDYQIYMTDARQFDEISDTSFQDIEDQAIDSQDEDVKPTPDCSGQPGLKTLDHQTATTVVSTTRVEYAPQRPNIDPLPEELDVVSTTCLEYASQRPNIDPLPEELDVVSTTRVEYAPQRPYIDPLPEELDVVSTTRVEYAPQRPYIDPLPEELDVVSTTCLEYASQRPYIDPLPEELDVVSTTRVEYAPQRPYIDPLPEELDVVSTTRVEYAPKWPYFDPLPDELDDMNEVSKWPMVGLGVFGVAAIGIMVWKKFLR